jgi:hypothetical protein
MEMSIRFWFLKALWSLANWKLTRDPSSGSGRYSHTHLPGARI